MQRLRIAPTFRPLMITLAVVFVLFAFGTSRAADGTIHFNTRMPPVVDAPVMGVDGSLAGSLYVGQLLVGRPGESLVPVGRPILFGSGNRVGYITTGGIVKVPNLAPGTRVEVQLAAWNSSLGISFDEAFGQTLGGVGLSAVVRLDLGNGTNSPALLRGLQGFQVTQLIPEPSTRSLGFLGAILLGTALLRRRSSSP